MNFVRTTRDGRQTVYLPGSSLKGVLRAHCERLARTVDSKERQQRQNGKPLACDPLNDRHSCSARLEKQKNAAGPRKFQDSCFLCQLFGNTGVASHFRIADAYPDGEYRTEERNGVAIDRVFGSVAVGPFNYETVIWGKFKTALQVKNFTLAQLGLLSLALRDLSQQRVRVGFGKSRGMGVVAAQVNALTLRYPLCELEGGQLLLLGGRAVGSTARLIGVGRFGADDGYGYPPDDEVDMPGGFAYQRNAWQEIEVNAPQDGDAAAWEGLGRECVKKWKEEVERGN
jgi:CRISPR/Cas system CSM-associated protein Csm3 (group 7 of RAMP superfamily)